MAVCPFATYEPVTNQGGPMVQHVGVVLHVTASETNPWSWFNNPAAQASSHFFIGNGQGSVADGSLYQFVDTVNTAWAEVAGNASYVSVETEGEPTEALTNNQILTFARLYAWIVEQYPYLPLVVTDTPGTSGFILHSDGGAAWGGHYSCPGSLRANQRTAILYIALLVLNPTPQGEEEMLVAATSTRAGYWCVKADGSVYAYGDAQYKKGINNAGPNGTTALVPGDVPTSLAGFGTDGYLIATEKNNLYGFGSAPYYGHP